MTLRRLSGVNSVVGASAAIRPIRLIALGRAVWWSQLMPAGVGGCRPSVCVVVG